MWTLWKTAVFAVFQVPWGRVLCVLRDGSVHIVFDRSKILNTIETRKTPLRIRLLEQGGYQNGAPLDKIVPGAS